MPFINKRALPQTVRNKPNFVSRALAREQTQAPMRPQVLPQPQTQPYPPIIPQVLQNFDANPVNLANLTPEQTAQYQMLRQLQQKFQAPPTKQVLPMPGFNPQNPFGAQPKREVLPMPGFNPQNPFGGNQPTDMMVRQQSPVDPYSLEPEQNFAPGLGSLPQANNMAPTSGSSQSAFAPQPTQQPFTGFKKGGVVKKTAKPKAKAQKAAKPRGWGIARAAKKTKML